MVAALREKFADLNLTYSIGGQISFDVFPAVRCGRAENPQRGTVFLEQRPECMPKSAACQLLFLLLQGWDKTFCLRVGPPTCSPPCSTWRLAPALSMHLIALRSAAQN